MKIPALLLLALALAKSSRADQSEVIDGEYLVLMKESAAITADRAPLSVAKTLHTGDIGGHAFLHVRATEQQYQYLLRDNSIQIIEPNRKVSLIKPVGPEHSPVELPDRVKTMETHGKAESVCEVWSSGIQEWGLTRVGSRDIPDFADDTFYEMAHYGIGVDIYILDTGIDVDHVEFNRGPDVTVTHGFVLTELSGEGETDFHGHGTHVAGIAGGFALGMAKLANLVAVKILDANGNGDSAGIASGVMYVTERVRADKNQGKKPRAIINMSLGGPYYSAILENAIQEAIDEGIIVIVAAGNWAESASLHYPAGLSNTITVGATDINDKFASFSNYGDMVDIIAPGVLITAAGSTNSSRCATIPPGLCAVIFSGTSQAAPHVAGVVARHLESLSDSEMDAVNQESIRQLLISRSTKCKISYQNNDQSKTPNRLLHDDCTQSEGISCTSTSTLTPMPSHAIPTTLAQEPISIHEHTEATPEQTTGTVLTTKKTNEVPASEAHTNRKATEATTGGVSTTKKTNEVPTTEAHTNRKATEATTGGVSTTKKTNEVPASEAHTNRKATEATTGGVSTTKKTNESPTTEAHTNRKNKEVTTDPVFINTPVTNDPSSNDARYPCMNSFMLIIAVTVAYIINLNNI